MLNTAVGQVSITDGVNNSNMRQGRMGDLVVTELQGRYYEQASRSNVYTATIVGVGLVLTAANCLCAAVPGAGTAAPIVGLVNPANSGVNLSINRAKIQTISGTPGGGFVFGFLAAQASLCTAATVKGISAATLTTGGRAGVLLNVTVTGTTALFAELRGIGGPAAIAAGAGLYCVDEETAGDVIVPPGAILGIFGYGAGTSHVVKGSITWAEVPV